MISPQIIYYTDAPPHASKLTPKQYLLPPLPPSFQNVKMQLLQDVPLAISQLSPVSAQLIYATQTVLIELQDLMPVKNYRQQTITSRRSPPVSFSQHQQTCDLLFNGQLYQTVAFKFDFVQAVFLNQTFVVFSQSASTLILQGYLEQELFTMQFEVPARVRSVDFDGTFFAGTLADNAVFTGQILKKQAFRVFSPLPQDVAQSPILTCFISHVNGVVVTAFAAGLVVFSDLYGQFLQLLDLNALLATSNTVLAIVGTRQSTQLNLALIIEKSPILALRIDLSQHRLITRQFLSRTPQMLLSYPRVPVQTLLALLSFVQPFAPMPQDARPLYVEKLHQAYFPAEVLRLSPVASLNALRLEVLVRVAVLCREGSSELTAFRGILASLCAQAGKCQFARALGLNVQSGEADANQALSQGRDLRVQGQHLGGRFDEVLSGERPDLLNLEGDLLFADFAQLQAQEGHKVFGWLE
ncbi:hypothetical protein SS50377_20845 [Spironucleus salmonicida]|uniref:Uncharacterized protein n=1 Tax=Spironucleus salmonicida TaxID=348837 RepID=A0A9P8S287_9EUKA|nr:hypothetical protein SS50377_20845 [Spironucleus salmonicida]